MQGALLGQSLGPGPEREGYICPRMTLFPLSLVAGVLQEAGDTQLPPNDHHLPPQKRRDPDSHVKSQVDFKALLGSGSVIACWELEAFNTPLNPLPEVFQYWLPLSFLLGQGPGHPLPMDVCLPCQEQVTPGFFCSNHWQGTREREF